MPRVKQVVAAKDYPKFGIVKGQKHYHWKRKTGPRSSQEYRQVEPPRIEQLTSSSYKIAIHHLEKAREQITSYEELDSFKDSVEELAAEQREKFDNMPEGLQQGDTGQTLEQQADTLDSAAEEIDTLRDEWETAYGEWQTAKEEYDSLLSDYEKAQAEYDDLSDEEQENTDPPEEPEEVEDEFDADEYLGRLSDIQLEA